MSGFLLGKTVVLTRAKDQSASLSEFLCKEGADVIELPMVEIQDPEDGGIALESSVREINNYEWVVVTSPNAANRITEVLGGVIPTTSFAAVGTQTANALTEAGCQVKHVPKKAVGELLLSEFVSPSKKESKILFIRAEKVRPLLANGLRDLGWIVEEVIAYRNIQPPVDEERFNQARKADAIIFASTSAVNRYTELMKIPVPETALCIGPITAKAARDRGYKHIYQADPYSVGGLILAAREWAAN
ncbi:MAG TPA: uroporphyrinogen-III synthase [Acidimicrobiales bacterium]|nr:uroporphyrinogen-III synthase [Acidimicrobiales bacterium]|tara:strand:- start:763 stop:1500 length:738 start_codon:yes stop_codon:yes gene_type:complete